MTRQRKLRMKNYMNHHPTTGALENAVMEWQVPDDISIVGILLWAECSALGGIRLAEVSLAGTFGTDVGTANIEEESDKKVLLFGADKSYAVGEMPQCDLSQVWFGKDFSVDVDEDSFIYVHQYGTAAKTGMTRVIIYYVER